MTQIQYPNDVTGSIQVTHGSDGRLNVSSRSDSRGYYNSRDLKQSYSLVFDDAAADANDYIVYWKNDSTDKQLVIGSVGVNSTVAGSFKLHFVTGTVSGGSTLTPLNLNRTSANDAVATCSGNGALSGLTSIGEIDQLMVTAGGHEEFRLGDRIRLGQNDAIALEYDRGSVTIAEGVIFGFYE